MTTTSSPGTLSSTLSTTPSPCASPLAHSISEPNKCYYGVLGKETWFYARNVECDFLFSFVADMLSIENAFENSEIRDFINGTDEIWLGLWNNGGTWMWAGDSSSSTYRNWANGEPNPLNQYAYLRSSDGKWYTGNFLEKRHYICQLPI